MDAYFTSNVFDRLIHRDVEGRLVPGVLKEWTASPDGLTWDLTLRPDVRFHNGTAVSSKDVQFSFERMKKTPSSGGIALKSVREVTVVDDKRLKFSFNEYDVTFLPQQGVVYFASKDYFDAGGERQFKEQPVGTGPYQYAGRRIGEGFEIKAFKDYWGGAPSVERAVFRAAGEPTTRLAMLKAGEADIVVPTPFTKVAEVEGTAGLKTVRFPAPHPQIELLLNTLLPDSPWANKKVRQAAAHAIDAQGIVNKLQFGVPAYYWGLPPWELGYDSALKPPEYSPQLARQLLAEAGYPNGFDALLYNPITERVPGVNETGQAIAAMLNQVGIRMKIQNVEYGVWLGYFHRFNPPDLADATTLSIGGLAGAADPLLYINLFYGANGTYSYYNNPKLEELISKNRSETDRGRRAEQIREMVRIIRDDLPRIPIFANVVVYSMRKDVEFTPTKGDALAVVMVKDVKLTR